MIKKLSLPYPYIIVGLIAAVIGVYFRLFPILSYTSNEASERAAMFILNQVRQKVSQNIEQTHPKLPQAQKNILIKKTVDEIMHNDAEQMRRTIEETSLVIQRKDTNAPKMPYLLESDPFYYYYLTERIIEKGSISDKIKGSKYYHDLMIAPEGFWEPFNLNPYVGLIIYKISKLFDPTMTVMGGVGYTPIAITCLAIIPFIGICRGLGCSPISALAGTVFFLLAHVFMKRSTYGWYDNDPYNIFFPLTIIYLLYNSIKNLSYPLNPKLWAWAAATAVTMWVYTLFWQGWVFFYTLIICFGIALLVDDQFILKKKSITKPIVILFSSICALSFVLIGILFGPHEFFVLFQEGWKALSEFLTPQLSAWPDMYLSVGELHHATPELILDLTGGPLPIFGAGLAIIWMVWDTLRVNKFFGKNAPAPDMGQRFLFYATIIFFCLTLFITLGAQRFAILFLIPLSLAFALFLELVFRSIQSILTKLFSTSSRSTWVTKGIYIVASIIILSTTYIPLNFVNTKMREILNPIFNDTWNKSLSNLRENTPNDAIINTWWSPGHFIKAIAHRRVTFDGATINFPQAYWMSNVYLSTDEDEAVGILRMLNNSANQSAVYLQSLGLPLSDSVAILKGIAGLDALNARLMLMKIFKNANQVEKLMTLTFRDPPPTYLLIYNELVDKNLQFPFIGRWNFRKIEEINKNPDLMKKVPPHNTQAYIDFLWELAGGAPRYSDILPVVGHHNDEVIFAENVFIDLKTKECHVNSKKFGVGIPQSLFYVEDGAFIEKKFENARLPYSAAFVVDNGTPICILMDRDLARSMLMRLYFFHGAGLKHFEKFSDDADLTKRTRIMIFKVNY